MFTNKEDICKEMLRRAKTNAKKRNLEFDLDLRDIIVHDLCPVFSKPFIYRHRQWTYSVDRIDNTKGYIKGNVRIISMRANRLKHNATIEELELLVKNWDAK